MLHNLKKLSTQCISQQYISGRIQRIDQAKQQQRLKQEQAQLQTLQRASASYLNQYDQLFRLVSIELLILGYDLTNVQPHQVLKAVLLFHFPQIDVNAMIQHRHELKKQIRRDVLALHQQNLLHVLDAMQSHLQAYEICE